MRTVVIAATGWLIASGMAVAQRPAPGAPYPPPGAAMRPAPPRVAPPAASALWGSDVDGRWWGGANAPGGWSAYRRPYRGWALPPYWADARFTVADWSGYGLARPLPGYRWARYYDDAVLVDRRGSVFDAAYGVDWRGAAGAAYADAPPARRDSGLGGAAVGALAGGVAGNVIAGRGNRLGGTLIGAGLGGAAGYAIDRAEDRGRPRRDEGAGPPIAPDLPPPPPGYDDPYGGGYDPYGYDPYGYPPPPAVAASVPPPTYRGGSGQWTSPDGRTTVTTTTVGGNPGFVQGGWYHPGASTTTVTVQTAPVVTTTTDVVDERVTYRAAPRARSGKYVTRARR